MTDPKIIFAASAVILLVLVFAVVRVIFTRQHMRKKDGQELIFVEGPVGTIQIKNLSGLKITPAILNGNLVISVADTGAVIAQHPLGGSTDSNPRLCGVFVISATQTRTAHCGPHSSIAL